MYPKEVAVTVVSVAGSELSCLVAALDIFIAVTLNSSGLQANVDQEKALGKAGCSNDACQVLQGSRSH